jgi:hypothetical protein
MNLPNPSELWRDSNGVVIVIGVAAFGWVTFQRGQEFASMPTTQFTQVFKKV